MIELAYGIQCHPSKLPIHKMGLYICGDHFLKRYTMLTWKIAVVYDNLNICLVYDKIFMFFNHCVFTEEITSKLPLLVWTNMYICNPRLGTSHNPLKGIIYWVVIYDRYMSSGFLTVPILGIFPISGHLILGFSWYQVHSTWYWDIL